jgi:thiol-disulfide isomerase/thioredoxin
VARGAGPQRRVPWWPIGLLGLFALAYLASVLFGGPQTSLVHWRAPGETVVADAGKPVLYDFSAASCAPCRSMNAEVFNDPAAAAQINAAFLPVRVVVWQHKDRGNAPAVAALEQRFEVRGFPTLVVARPDGTLVARLEGYPGHRRTFAWLREQANAAATGR